MYNISVRLGIPPTISRGIWNRVVFLFQYIQESPAMNYRNGRAIGLATALIASFLPLLLWSQPKTVQTAQLIRDSEVIVVGTVG